MHRFYRQPFNQPIRQPVWNDLIVIEPLLATLKSIVLRMSPPTEMPEYWRAWTRIKCAMEQLVGWESFNPTLRNEFSFNVAHDHLLDLYERRAAEVSKSMEA